RAQGFVNLPAGGVDFRLAFIASEGDGYIRNTVDNRRFAEDDYWGVRGSLRVDTSDAWILDVMAQHIRDDGATGDLWTPNPLYLPDPHDIRLTTVTLENPYLVSEIDSLSINLEYDLGFASFRSISGYVRSNVRNVDDCAGEPFLNNCFRFSDPNDFDQWSQELQLVFPRSGSLEGIVGAYYSDADAELGFFQLLPVVNLQPLNNNLTTRSEPYAAIFGQLTWHFAERWTSTAGLRFSREELRVASIGSGVNDTHTLFTDETDSDNFSWLLDVTYAVTDDLMLYASASTGNKSGGFVTASPPNGIPHAYGPEHVTAFEVGEKSEWLDGRLMLNAAAFLYDYDDLQVSNPIIVDGVPIFGVDNAAEARIHGLDAETSYALTEQWALSGGVVWLPEREFVEYDQGNQSLSGNKLVRAPEWSARAAVDYERAVGELGRLSARLEYSYRSSYYYTAENLPEYSQDSFGLLNAYLRFESASESWYVFASGRNLTSEDYFTQVFFQSSPGYPDTYEVGFGIRF
ncbi:MAG TPA: TonB-dependent receptor, partial [Vicinamibacterales bacterium]|nr:TonB-dependent receptor [Vicinamibacterales bacterium]